MKGIVQHRYGPPEVLAMEERALVPPGRVPPVGQREVRVGLHEEGSGRQAAWTGCASP